MKVIITLLFLLLSLIQANQLKEVSLQLKWKYQFQFAGFIAAKEKGFYKDLGLDVKLLEYKDSTDTIKDMKEGKIEFGVSDSALMIEALKGTPVVAMMAIYQKSPYVLMALKSSNIKTIKDIDGKRLAIYNDINGMAIKSMLKLNNINFIQKPIDAKLKKLKNKEIDLAISYISNEPYVAKEMGMDVVTIDPSNDSFSRYGDILFTFEDTIKNNPELVENMYQATKKGFEYAFSNIDEMVDIIYSKYNTQNKSKNALRYEANTLSQMIGSNENFGVLNQAKVESIGYIYSYSDTVKYDKSNLKDFIYKPLTKTNRKVNLTKNEQEYLNSIENISMCYNTTITPYTMIENGKPVGVSVDYLNKIEKKINKKFNFVYSNSIKQQFEMLYNKECVTVPVIQTSPQAVPFVQSTISAGKDNLVLITRIDEPYIFNMDKINNKKIGINKDYIHLTTYLDKNHPQIKYIKIDGHGLLEVEKGELFGVIGTSITMNYELTKKFKNSLKVMTDYPNSYIEGGIGVHIDEPILLSILNKAVASIDTVQQDDVFDKWINVKYTKVIDYTLVWQIIIISLVLIGFTLFWNSRLKKEIQKTKLLQTELKELNDTLEERIKEEVEKNKKHQIIMMQQSRHAQMGEMISMIAHQWRHPLNSLSLIIQNTIFKYKMGKLDDDLIIKFDKDSSKQIKQMSNTISDFRNFFKPEKQSTEFNISDSIYHAINIVDTILKSENINLELNINKKLKLNGYPSELGQVIVNILTNAKDALVSKNINNKTIKLSLSSINKKIIISIKDNAGGIDKEIIDKIFDPYFSTKYEKNGTGLGLYMSKIIIEDHMKGTLTVQNNTDGVEFEILL